MAMAMAMALFPFSAQPQPNVIFFVFDIFHQTVIGYANSASSDIHLDTPTPLTDTPNTERRKTRHSLQALEKTSKILQKSRPSKTLWMSSELERTLNLAKYNEVVTIQAEDNESGTVHNVALVATIDREKGGVLWQQLQEEDGQNSSLIKRHLLTKQWIYPMLNDTDRNKKYEEAIKRACEKLGSDGDEIHCLDIGSGTGLLAMFVDRYASPIVSKIVSVEMESLMAQIASLHIRENEEKGSPRIEINEGHSCSPDFVLKKKSKLCTSELLESGLLNEGIIPALRDAWARHLTEDALCVPCGARVYAQLVEGHESILHYTQIHHKRDFIRLTTSSNSQERYATSSSKRLPLHIEHLLGKKDVKILSDPVLVLEFDFSKGDKIPSSQGGETYSSIDIHTSGSVHGVIFWWELDLFDGITYSTEVASNGKQNWQDHWHQNLFAFNFSKHVSENEKLILYTFHDDSSISFDVVDESVNTGVVKKQRLAQEGSNSNLLDNCSPERIKELNDVNRLDFFDKSIQSAIEVYSSGVSVIDLSDFSLCGIIASKYGAKVTSIGMNWMYISSSIFGSLICSKDLFLKKVAREIYPYSRRMLLNLVIS